MLARQYMNNKRFNDHAKLKAADVGEEDTGTGTTGPPTATTATGPNNGGDDDNSRDEDDVSVSDIDN